MSEFDAPDTQEIDLEKLNILYKQSINEIGPIYNPDTEPKVEFQSTNDVLPWIGQANVSEQCYTPTFENMDSLVELLKITKEYEIGIMYFDPNSQENSRFNGIFSIIPRNNIFIPFLGMYGHTKGEGSLLERRTHVIIDPGYTEYFLKKIGLIGGTGHIVITKGDENCVRYKIPRFPTHDFHTHPDGMFSSLTPSTEDSNASYNPKGGDYAYLENKLYNVPDTEPPYKGIPTINSTDIPGLLKRAENGSFSIRSWRLD